MENLGLIDVISLFAGLLSGVVGSTAMASKNKNANILGLFIFLILFVAIVSTAGILLFTPNNPPTWLLAYLAGWVVFLGFLVVGS